MEGGLITKWLKREGDSVLEGEGIVGEETEKTTDEIQAPAWTLLKIVREEGTAVPVNAVIVVIGSKGEDISSISELAEPAAPTLSPPPTEKIESVQATAGAAEPSLVTIGISP
jgi:pyruvate dehydrogenase E2 component (dihydrolipoamide acetyltransferase)